jgi:U4/U6.U5 tri-snRNP-associated protein 2
MEQSGAQKRPREEGEGNGHSNGIKLEEGSTNIPIKSENNGNDQALPNNSHLKHEPASNNNNEVKDEYEQPVVPERKKPKQSMRCPYLDTVNRQMLDFDFEKLCSVSLSNLNVYACLVCGKYFQGIFCLSYSFAPLFIDFSISHSYCTFISC